VLGWAQLGVRTMECIGFTDSSLSYGRQLTCTLGCQDFAFSFRKPHESSSVPQGASGSRRLVCGHILPNPGRAFLDFLARVPPTTFLLCTVHKDAFHQVQQSFGAQYHWEDLRHRRLGGLTLARLIVLWRSDNPVKDEALRPGNRQSPLQPLAAFLEPSARLTEWCLASSQVAVTARRKKDCWCPLEVEAVPYPWPWSGAP
jgi:hypothetical protein